MTLEEAKIVLINRGFVEVNGYQVFDGDKWRNAIAVISKWLEEQPCEDVVSRQAVLDALDNHKYSKEFCEEHHIDWSINLDMANIAINDLPSVIPKEKTGWHIIDGRVSKKFCCSCGYIEIMDNSMNNWNYCPICGAAKMIDQQGQEEVRTKSSHCVSEQDKNEAMASSLGHILDGLAMDLSCE